jgi:hypothetical protein
LRDRDDVAPDLRAAAAFTLARTLWETNEDRARAVALATQARTRLKAATGSHTNDLQLVEQWLTEHQLAPDGSAQIPGGPGGEPAQ